MTADVTPQDSGPAAPPTGQKQRTCHVSLSCKPARQETEKRASSGWPRGGALLTQLAATVAAALAVSTNALAIGWGVVANWQLQQDAGGLTLTSGQRSWVIAVFYLGTAVGSPFGGRLSGSFGPRRTMLISMPSTVLASMVIYFASSFGILATGRLLLGISSGIAYAVYPMYISGTSSPRHRGKLCIMSDSICIGGIIVVIKLGELLPWWWLAAYCALVTTAPATALLLLLPDDPAWLAGRGRLDDAERCARALGVDPSVVVDWGTLHGGQVDSAPAATLRLLARRENALPLALVLVAVLASTFSGYMAILIYSLEFFRKAGLPLDASVCAMLFCGVRMAAGGMVAFLIDRSGRRVLLLASTGGVVVCYVGLFIFYQVAALQQYTFLPIVLLLLAVFMFSCGLSMVPFCLVGEMFPLRMRELGAALITSAYNVFIMASMLTFSPMLEALGNGGLFLAYAALMAAYLVFTLLFMPETKGLSLAAIETLFVRDRKKERRVPPPDADDVFHRCHPHVTRPTTNDSACAEGGRLGDAVKASNHMSYG